MIKSRDLYYTTNEAAQMAAVSPAHIRRLISEGKIKAEKLGTNWLIKKSDLTYSRKRFTTPKKDI